MVNEGSLSIISDSISKSGIKQQNYRLTLQNSENVFPITKIQLNLEKVMKENAKQLIKACEL